ncbi:unnamed protein product [Vicia faba]|uniref:GH18 domain-containing protein n=1 Tax=Vicia faba TaxID=3906 RepID=A0AAV1AGS0_VICFA|nr:unnamed protein product [Vicia faba]
MSSDELGSYRQYIHDIPTDGIDLDLLKKFKKIDFILSFAVENYDKHGKGDGGFHPTWNVSESIKWVKKLKKDHPEVRVFISIGGVGSEFPFDPAEKNQWIHNALQTITKILLLYDVINISVDDLGSHINTIDGIDIHYDVINSSEDDFCFCIGQVIKKYYYLDDVSIAPTKLVEPYYLKLYKDNAYVVELVDYQFYNQKFSSVEQVVDLYKKLEIDYTPASVIVGIANPVDPILYEGIKYLIKHNLCCDIFFWNSDDSIDFSLDKFLLDL